MAYQSSEHSISLYKNLKEKGQKGNGFEGVGLYLLSAIFWLHGKDSIIKNKFKMSFFPYGFSYTDIFKLQARNTWIVSAYQHKLCELAKLYTWKGGSI